MPHEHLTGHTNPWRQAQHAIDWIASNDQEPPERDEELGALISLLPFTPTAPIRILELGAGHGVLTRLLLDRFARAQVIALDLSPVMVSEGQRRLSDAGDRVRFIEWDLERPGWPEQAPGPFDAVVSSLAVHHLPRRQKALLAREVYAHLKPGGVLLHLDYVAPPSETLAERYLRTVADGEHRPHLAGGHATDTLLEQMDDLREAGLVDVDVFWKRYSLALFGGTRPV